MGSPEDYRRDLLWPKHLTFAGAPREGYKLCKMDFLVVTSATGEVLTGNRCTANQWAELLKSAGHRVRVVDAYAGQAADVLIAVHGRKGNAAVTAFRRAHPDKQVVIALTGTDVYPEPGEEALDSMQQADRLIALQPRVRDRIPQEFHDKLRIIKQSAGAAPSDGAAKNNGPFDVCVVGHLREVKDPLRAAAAARLLPAVSKIRIRHAGAILDPRYERLVEVEQAENPRYVWLDELTPAEAQNLMAHSRLTVVSSFYEGGARVIGESIVAGTPVLAARNDASLSLLGEDYPGLYAAGQTEELAGLMSRAETDSAFLDALVEHSGRLAPQFDPRHEREAWRELIAELEAGAEREGTR